METRVRPGDVLLVHIEEKPAFYARVEEILFDVKKGWRRLRFFVLTVPLQEMTWILEPCQIDGEPFTMGGTPIRLERLPDPVLSAEEPEPGAPPERDRPEGKVISFPARKES
jgi:hypothetical protein